MPRAWPRWISGERSVSCSDPPPQDLERLRNDSRYSGCERAEFRTLMFAFDVARDELIVLQRQGTQSIQGQTSVQPWAWPSTARPFETKGAARSCRSYPGLVPQGAIGYSAGLRKRQPLTRQKTLLRDAGFAQGFKVTLDCSNDREQMCSAIAGMLSKTGIDVASMCRHARSSSSGSAR